MGCIFIFHISCDINLTCENNTCQQLTLWISSAITSILLSWSIQHLIVLKNKQLVYLLKQKYTALYKDSIFDVSTYYGGNSEEIFKGIANTQWFILNIR